MMMTTTMTIAAHAEGAQPAHGRIATASILPGPGRDVVLGRANRSATSSTARRRA
jgi:hypothetical protein